MKSINNSKKGLMVYEPDKLGLVNLGDYIQSIASRQFTGISDVYVSREHLNEDTDMPIKLICNGWYMHQPQNWPPSASIDPLFVAIHINKLVENRFTQKDSIAYLKSHQPIGCRDNYTKQLLQSHGVDAYFSGCLTLTLGKTYKRTKVEPGKVFFTDSFNQSFITKKFKLKCIYNIIRKYQTIKKIKKQQNKYGINNRLRSVTAFYTSYSPLFEDDVLINAIYKTQQVRYTGQSHDTFFNQADELLKEYCSAQYVVTSRIHCALPCLAMGVPVLYVYNENASIEHNCRLDGLIQLFHLINIKSDHLNCKIIPKSKFSLNSTFTNKSDYKKLAEELINKCSAFMK